MTDRERAAPAEPNHGFWHPGYPPKPFSEEWFIAKLNKGGRVVLTALPEEYSYDFKTADETYFRKESVVAWAQFPDSEYIPYAADYVVRPREPTEAMIEAAFAELPPMTNGEGDVLDDAECREHIADALRAALTTRE